MRRKMHVRWRSLYEHVNESKTSSLEAILILKVVGFSFAVVSLEVFSMGQSSDIPNPIKLGGGGVIFGIPCMVHLFVFYFFNGETRQLELRDTPSPEVAGILGATAQDDQEDWQADRRELWREARPALK